MSPLQHSDPHRESVLTGSAGSMLIFGAICFIAAILLSAPDPLHAQDGDPASMNDEQLVDALMQASGFDSSLLDVWYGIRDSIDDEQELNPDQAVKVQNLLRSGFYGERLVEQYRSNLQARLDRSYAVSIIVFLQSDTGQHILEYETRESNATDAELQDFASSFDPQDDTNSVRIDLVQTLMSETRALENTASILHALYSNLLLTANAAENPPDERMSEQEFKSTSEMIRAQLDQQIGQYILISMLYTFRDANIEYLEKYAEHLRSESGRWYTSTLHDILIDVLEDAHKTVINEIRLTDS